MLQRLRDYLRQTTHEEFLRDWNAIKSQGINSPTARDLIRSFRYTPVHQYKESSFVSEKGVDGIQLTYELDDNTALLSLAA